MDEHDKELTRKAIEEILREAKEQRDRDEIRPNQERKINPLGKTNKQFLGRTINAVVRHNERTDQRNLRKCRKKLRELDKRRRGRSSRSTSNNDYKINKKHRRKERRISSDDSSEREKSKQLKSTRKKKHKRRKRRRRESSSSSSSCSSSSKSEHSREKASQDREQRLSNQNEAFRNRMCYEVTDMQPFEDNHAAWMVPPMLWTAAMQQFCQYKALMALGAAQIDATEAVQIEELSISSSSLSDVNFEEVPEYKPSGNVVLTINLSTEDEEESSTVSKKRSKSNSLKKNTAVESNSIELCDSNSDTSKNSNPVIEVTDSDDEEKIVDDVNSDCMSQKSIISLKSTDSNASVDLTKE